MKTNETGPASGGVKPEIDNPEAHDWPEDRSYICRCVDCKTQFFGPKRAPLCWRCWCAKKIAPPPTEQEPPDFVTAEHALNWLESVRPGWGKRVRERYTPPPAEPGETPRRVTPVEAIRSATKVLLNHFAMRIHDSEAVSDCVHCNAVFLAKESLLLLDSNAALSAEVERLRAERQWRPIENHDRSHRAVLVWCPKHLNIYEVCWRNEEYLGDPGWFHFSGLGDRLRETPTHWMPLPDEPEALRAEAGKEP